MLRAHSFRACCRRAPPSCFRATAPPLLRSLSFWLRSDFHRHDSVPFTGHADAPAQFGDVDQIAEGDASWKGRKPVFGRLFLALWPLDQQPLFWPAVSEIVITMGNTNAQPRKAGGQMLGRPLPPRDCAPSALLQAESKFLDRDRLMFVIPANELWRSAAARPLFGRQRPRARCPYGRLRHDAGDIAQRKRVNAGAQLCVAAIARVHQYHATRKIGLAGRIDLRQRNLGLGLEADILRHARLVPTFAVSAQSFGRYRR